MHNLDQIKITRRDQQVIRLPVQGCSNKETAAELEISPRSNSTFACFIYALGSSKAATRVILATATSEKE